MSNSKMVSYTKISPNSNNPRKNKIDKITIHHMAGNFSIEACGEAFSNPKRKASSNYGIGSDGRVGLYVDEANRSWCSSSAANDHRAVTIEVANDGKEPDWHVSDKALAALIDLCVDICKRNDIKALNFTGDKSGNLTQHNYFAATACPGPYLSSKFPYIAEEVNKRLQTPAEPQKSIDDIAKEVLAGKWGSGETRKKKLKAAGYDPAEVQAKVNELLAGDKPAEPQKSIDDIAKEVIAGKWGSGEDRRRRLKAAGYDPDKVQAKVNALLLADRSKSFEPYHVIITATLLNVRAGAGLNYKIKTTVKRNEVYTIVEEKNGWGKLKSGIGWLNLDYTKKV